MRVVCDVFSIRVPQHWRQLSADANRLRITADNPLDMYLSFSWQRLHTPLTVGTIAKMLIDSIEQAGSLLGESRKIATVVLVDRGRLKYAFCDARRKSRFGRCWNLHNGTHMIYVNYSSKWDGHEAGIAEAEQIVKSLRFFPTAV